LHTVFKRILVVAFEMFCIALRTGDCDDDVEQASKIIDLAKAGSATPIFCANWR
jgi:hypothetical protein